MLHVYFGTFVISLLLLTDLNISHVIFCFVHSLYIHVTKYISERTFCLSDTNYNIKQDIGLGMEPKLILVEIQTGNQESIQRPY